MATLRLARLIRRERPHILHTHTAKAGAIGRVAALLARASARPPIVHTFHGHVLRGYFGPRRAGGVPAASSARSPGARTRSSRSARRCATTSSRSASPRARSSPSIRLGIELEAPRRRRTASSRAGPAAARHLPADRFVVGWIGRMTGVKRTDDVLLALRRCASAASTPRSAWSATGPTATPSRSRRTSSGSRGTASSSATRTTSPPTTPRSTRSSCRRRTRARR